MSGLTFAEALEQIAGRGAVLTDEPMRLHTTFRIGGPADYFVTVHSAEEIRDTLKLCRAQEIPCFLMGNGSNLLVSDDGFRGTVIRLGREYGAVRPEGDELVCEAGASLSAIASEALARRLTGFEFAGGIPGTLGGACLMNAGAYGGEMKQVLRSVDCLTPEGRMRTVPAAEAELGYRHSRFMDDGSVILGARIGLTEGSETKIRQRMEELSRKRREKQPLTMPSAGSTFKRPEGYFAGKLIMDAGLRGYRVGGAQVSEKHCGFVVNTGGATAADVCRLICDVRDRVRDTSGVMLVPEVRFLGAETPW